MSSMEVDVPQVNGFSHNQSRVAKKSVHFGPRTAAAEVTIFPSAYKNSAEPKPKHKARRRARHPSKSEELENGTNPKPLSPNKILKMAEKDRHSRSGVRGLPKKGIHYLAFPTTFAYQI